MPPAIPRARHEPTAGLPSGELSDLRRSPVTEWASSRAKPAVLLKRAFVPLLGVS